MKYTVLGTVLMFLPYFLSISLVNSNQELEKFLQCLPGHTNPSNPISEAIYTPNNHSYTSVLESYVKNRRFLTKTTPKPLAIVTARDESHVQASVICAKSHNLQLRIRSGGHDFEGLSYISSVPFIILDILNLRAIDISIKNETAWVQAGATLGELYHGIANLSKVHAFPAGVCFTLGTGGHFSGAGYGNLMRKYGLSVDNIIDAQIVDVNGKILDRRSMGEDLFWAIKGGGGASFGVILAWKIKLVQVPETVTVFRVNRTLEQGATDLVYQWQHVASKLDKEVFIRLQLQGQNGSTAGTKTVRVDFIGMFLGRKGSLVSLLDKSFPELGLKQQDCHEMSWVESTLFWDEHPDGTSTDVLLERTNKTAVSFKFKSDYVTEFIPKSAFPTIWKSLIKDWKIRMQWNPYGGRMSEIPDTKTPFPYRAGYLFKIQHAVFWQEEGIEMSNHYVKSIREFYEAIGPYVTKNPREAFQNYRDLDIGSNPSNHTDFGKAQVYGHKYFKNNFLRLTQVKAKVDPDNFFKHEQSIPPYSSST